MKLKPLGDRVVVRPAEREEMTRSGIVLPDTARERPQEGTVQAVGPGRLLENGQKVPMDLAVGDRVIYAKYAGTEFEVEDVEYMVLSERDVLAVLTNGLTS